MSHISSIHFKKSNPIQAQHNDRLLPPSYLIGGDFEINKSSKEALILKNQIIQKAIENYNRTKPPKSPSFKAKSYEWSAVCNIKPETTMQDLEKLAEHFQKKYGFQCYQIAIHRDEGHINEKGEKVINHHAHLEFITLDKESGKSLFRAELQRPKALRQMQSEVAEILQMERGQDKRISGRERIEPRKYAQMKEAEKKEQEKIKQELVKEKAKNRELQALLVTQKEINVRIEAERKAWIAEKTHTADEYKQLRSLKEQQYKTIQELENKIIELNTVIANSKPKQETKEFSPLFASEAKQAKNHRDIMGEIAKKALEQEKELANELKRTALELFTKAIQETASRYDFTKAIEKLFIEVAMPFLHDLQQKQEKRKREAELEKKNNLGIKR